MHQSLDFDNLPVVDRGRAFFRVQRELSQDLRRMPRVFERVENAFRFLYWSMQDADSLRCPDEAGPAFRDGCVRAALTEVVSIEDMQAHDFREIGIHVSQLKLNDGSSPSWHLVRELRNLQTHLRQDTMSHTPKDVFWGHLDKPTETWPLTINIFILQGIDERAFQSLQNAKRYSSDEIVRMIQWFNKAQGEWGVQEVLACVIEDYCRALLARAA